MAKARMAKEALKWLFKSPETGQLMKRGQIINRLLPETLVAGFEVAMTPGNVGSDKDCTTPGVFNCNSNPRSADIRVQSSWCIEGEFHFTALCRC